MADLRKLRINIHDIMKLVPRNDTNDYFKKLIDHVFDGRDEVDFTDIFALLVSHHALLACHEKDHEDNEIADRYSIYWRRMATLMQEN